MSERTVEQICRDLLNKVPCKTPTSAMDLAPMANELSKILNDHIVRHAGIQPDLAHLRKDAERYRKLRDGGDVEQRGVRCRIFYPIDQSYGGVVVGPVLDAAVDALT